MAALYGLVNLASDDRIYPLVKKVPDQRRLFGGPLEPSKERSAPHIVRLNAAAELRDA